MTGTPAFVVVPVPASMRVPPMPVRPNRPTLH